MKTQNKYQAWKAKSNGDLIDGTDRILVGHSKRAVLKHLAFKEGVKYQHNDVVVKCKDGTMWCVSLIAKNEF